MCDLVVDDIHYLNPYTAELLECCPDCSGDGGHEGPFCHVDYRDGSAWGDWFECSTCNGTGTVLMSREMSEADWEEWDYNSSEAFSSVVALAP